MTDPALELQGAITPRLKTYSPLTALIGAKVYSEVPIGAVVPYVSFGPTDSISDDADCIDADEVSTQIDVWAANAVECRRITDLVRRALKTDVEFSDNALAILEHDTTRVFRDADGKTFHGVVTMRSVIERS